MSTSTTKFWLLKAEPDTRIVKGKNVQVGSRSNISFLTAWIGQGRVATYALLNHLFRHANIIWEFSSVSMILNASEHHLGRVYGIMRLEI